MQELQPGQLERARRLLQACDYSLSIPAAIQGNNPGRIFVDNVDEPQTAFALTVEGYFLVGEDGNPETNAALSRLLKERIFTGEVYVNGDDSLSLAVHPETWEARLPELIPTHDFEKNLRYQYLCREVKPDWRANLPEGYTIRRVDRALLDDPGVVFPEVIQEWIELEQVWGSVENFLAKGVSYVALHEGEVAAWCTPDCVAGDRIDVGIITHPAHRRKGLATATVAATVEHCLSHGFSAVGWHCNAFNVGSCKTAEKAGFERNREYAYYYYIYDLIDHLAELGWYHYRQGNYAGTVAYYEQVFKQRDDNPDYYYHLAASAWALLGNRENALKHLLAAVEHGWDDLEFTREQEEFEILHDTPEWRAMLERQEAGS